MKKRVHVDYRGTVQGVGFRFTSRHFACQLNINGWVKNLPDGSVELLAEGEEEALIEFLTRVKDRMFEYIFDESVNWQPYKAEFKEFEIKF